jgi:hypothetical protein
MDELTPEVSIPTEEIYTSITTDEDVKEFNTVNETIYDLQMSGTQIKFLSEILIDHSAMFHGARAYGENAKKELVKLGEAAENEESKAKVEEGLAALKRDEEFINIAEERFLDVYNLVLSYAETN